MSAALLSVLIWAPFAVIAVIFGVVFAVLGYKRGAVKAAVSVGVTVLSAALSVLLARLLAGAVGGLVKPLVDNLLKTFASLDSEAASTLIRGIGTAIAALLLFAPIYILLMLLFKNLTALVFTRGIPKPKSIGSKLGGLALGIADALVMAFLLLLPLYGTVSLVGDGVTVLSAVSGEEQQTMLLPQTPDPLLTAGVRVTPMMLTSGGLGDSARLDGLSGAVTGFRADAEEIAARIKTSPLIKIADLTPFSYAYDSLASFRFDGRSISLSKAFRTAIRAARAVLGDGSKEAMLRALDEAEAMLTDSKLFSELAIDLIQAVKLDGQPLVDSYGGFSDPEVFRGDLKALFGIPRSLIENDIFSQLTRDGFSLDRLDRDTLAGLSLGSFPRDLAEALNSSESLAGLKASLINNVMESVLASAGEERDLSAIREAIGTVSPTPLTGGDVAAEGDSLALIFSALLQRTADPESDETRLAGAVAEALARHPSVGVDKVVSAAALLLGKDQTDPLVDALRDELTAVAGKPVGEESFSDSAAAMMAAVNAMSVLEGNTEGTADAFAVLLSADGDLLSRLSGMLSDELLRSIGFTEETAEKVSSLFPSIADVISSSAYSKAEARAEAEALNRILTAEVALADGAEDRWEQIGEMLESYVSSDVCAKVTKVLTAEKSDPLSLYRDLSDADRETLLGRLSATAAAHPEKAEALSDLARFFGLSLAK